MALMVALTGCSKSPPKEEVTKEEMAKAQTICEKTVARERKGSDLVEATETSVFGSWVKDGKPVFEVGYKEKFSNSDAYSIQLCVYDEAAGTITLPSPSDSAQWRK